MSERGKSVRRMGENEGKIRRTERGFLRGRAYFYWSYAQPSPAGAIIACSFRGVNQAKLRAFLLYERGKELYNTLNTFKKSA